MIFLGVREGEKKRQLKRRCWQRREGLVLEFRFVLGVTRIHIKTKGLFHTSVLSGASFLILAIHRNQT